MRVSIFVNVSGHLEKHIQSLGKSNNLSVYAPWMPTLVQRVDEAVRAKRFSQPPRGPLGLYGISSVPCLCKGEKKVIILHSSRNTR